MEYFVTIRGTDKMFLIEEGPFPCVAAAVTYITDNGYFSPPELPHQNAGTVIDKLGVASVIISRSRANCLNEMSCIPGNIFSISIRRADYIVLEQERRDNLNKLLTQKPQTSSNH